MSLIRSFFGRFGFGAMSEHPGMQQAEPSVALVPDTPRHGADGALQLSTVWACIERRASVIASLPLFLYLTDQDGQRTLARDERLYSLLHDSPNPRMTAMEFWRAMVMNHDLRGAGYARIDRDAKGEAIALWPMPTDQVTPFVLDDGAMAYEYRIGTDIVVLAEKNVLVIKGLGNGTTGLDKLEFMAPTVNEAAQAQISASKIFGNGGKPTGVLMLDRVLNDAQRDQINRRFGEMAAGSTSRLFVLEAAMKYQQLSLSPQDQQLLQTRQFSVEEICRWFDVPPVLVYHSNVTTWGTGVSEINSGWYKVSIRPMLVSIEQAIRKRVMSPRQRASMTAEFSFEALLRADSASRAQFYSTALQNGYMTRNEVRQLENLPPMDGANELTAQSNMLPIEKLGQQGGSSGNQVPAAQ